MHSVKSLLRGRHSVGSETNIAQEQKEQAEERDKKKETERQQ
jgi:hypothetical protein